MHTREHHKEEKSPRPTIRTLADLHLFIAGLDMPQDKAAPIRSAIKRVGELVGHGALDIPAMPQMLLEQLDTVSPAMAGMSKAAYANMVSRLRAAFRLARPWLANPRSRYKLAGDWGAIQQAMDVREQRTTSRLFHFAARNGWVPQTLCDQHLERFAAHLREEALVLDWEQVVRSTVRGWNTFAGHDCRFKLPLLTPPPLKRQPYWIAPDKWPASLRDDAEALIAELKNPIPFRKRAVRPRKPSTVEAYRNIVSTLVSSLVRSGVRFETIPRLADVVRPENMDRALRFLIERKGGRIVGSVNMVLIRGTVIAEWCELPEADLRRLRDMQKWLANELPRGRTMTDKNRRLLDRLGNDQRFSDLVHTLPGRLYALAGSAEQKGWAAVAARTALAIELLLVCSMRRDNLVKLRLGQSIKRMGQPPHHSWVIELSGEEVKNHDPLRYVLPPPTVEMLEDYLAVWRPRLCAEPNPWLFPDKRGSHVFPPSMTLCIERHSRKILGVRVSPHQFRHLSAESFLLEHPDKLETISQHLGHRDPNTTRSFYAKPKQRQASRAYQEHVLGQREVAAGRLVRGGRKSTPIKRGGD